MKAIDKQTLITKSLFKKMQGSVWTANFRTEETLDVVTRDVIARYVKNAEISRLTDEEKNDLSHYLQRAFSE